MPQFMINKELRPGETAVIEGSDAHHISSVLRLKPGDWIVLSDGCGNRFRAIIKKAGRKGVSAAIDEALPKIRGSELTLAIALIKHDRLELVIQKAVELGVTKIIPFTSERTIPKYSEGVLAKKLERWNKIAIEAAKQCGLPFRPTVEPIHTLDSLCHSESLIVPSPLRGEGQGGGGVFKNKILFYEGEKNISIDQYFNTKAPRHQDTKTLIVIGPEGGFTSNEVELAQENGFSAVGLGPLIMRVDTAAIAAITLTQYFLGHFDDPLPL